jgi:hypothetical protein
LPFEIMTNWTAPCLVDFFSLVVFSAVRT